VALFLSLFRSMVLDWNVVPTGSMKPTILEGDYIFVNKLAYGLKVPFTSSRLFSWSEPDRGDIVVFAPPGETDRYVKRVVGLPGDRLEMRDNQLCVNGAPCRYRELGRSAPPTWRRCRAATGWGGRCWASAGTRSCCRRIGRRRPPSPR